MKKVSLLYFFFFLLVPTVLAQVSRGPTRVIVSQAREVAVQSLFSNNFFIFLLLFSLAILLLWKSDFIKRLKNKKFIILGIIVVLWVAFFMGNVESSKQQPVITLETDWQRDYEIITQDMSREYLKRTDMYNFDSSEIQAVIEDIKANALNLEDAVYMALEYTYDNVEYIRGESDSACFTKSASDILASGNGQCDTQTRVNIAILRGLGILAKPVGGCVWASDGCNLKFSIYAITGNPIRKPKWNEIDLEDLEQEYISREGGLHAWLEVYLPNKGWVIAESTAGIIMDDPNNCIQYDIELYPSNENTKEFCVTKNMTYARMCYEK